MQKAGTVGLARPVSRARDCFTAARQRHPYTNPAFLVIPVEGGSPDYLGWLMQETATE